jgi:AcrR family transcriptional regulator
VESIAEAAGTNKMTLYRHFASKDELVAEYLRQQAAKAEAWWADLEAQHAGDPLAQVRAWLAAMAAHVVDGNSRGCALANAAVELPEKEHPARAVIEECKRRQREALIRLCAKAALSEAEMLADEFLLLIEGARVTAQSIGADGLDARLMRMSEALIAAHRAGS